MNKEFFSPDDYYKIDPFRFGFLKKIVYQKEIDDYMEDIIEIELQSRSYSILKLKLKGISEVKTENISSNFFLQVEIRDISDLQLEGKKYYIVDVENNNISFYCNQIEEIKVID